MEAESLNKHDAEQVAFMAEECILVDESDAVTGSASKADCHHGEGVLHRAFSILIFNSEGRLLLQQRSSEKITFPGVWANTCCSHPLHCELELETQDAMGVKRAAQRKLEQELGIPETGAPLEDMVFMTRMLYRARANAEWVEHEMDHIICLRADVEPAPNPNEIAETRWVTQAELRDLLNSELIGPWFRLIAENLLPAWWENLDDLTEIADTEIHDMGEVTWS
ncbi:MAG: isopentenyl-diphosphate delta-isomerase [Candidatus Poseidoniia archaeon]|jgi:isopentenyl-diphosphate delta-isomerase|nr:isopentenyl-diphosphate delta-isomerase [Candidatus Poseidoniia archaeon]MDP7474227.1 isopentenyl-diphosphate delta-isomerase [Candidatus Poseidoniia archaeon]MDP7589916.1 isopentenyl-diphosphate delta-isomerase [Candidatus Poseidoniia archaeon]HJO27975.1 isopentenyl-diphosphate delta-isomerase [Candidatus Poseidoniia archaeon]|tara:strand:+ start:1511 stop:2182 length:672 start_codon:yes stop_codon:yes gene_type:complete